MQSTAIVIMPSWLKTENQRKASDQKAKSPKPQKMQPGPVAAVEFKLQTSSLAPYDPGKNRWG
jgi:hypothetical protein